ncbi:MAG TPA: Hpt domain-containing protein, partial [Rhodocyclaceae bacterium]|nr:Hpt domain-containing protein [Rhodocyclaceae bacterium]
PPMATDEATPLDMGNAPATGAGWPDSLPPFDIPAALIRTSGKRTLLRDLILMFHENYANVVADLRRLTADGVDGSEEATRLAHSLKGVAATLEAKSLAAAALIVERACAAGQRDGLSGLIDVLEQEIAPALAAAASLQTQTNSDKAARSVVDAGRIAGIVDELFGYLETYDMQAVNSVEQLVQELDGDAAAAEIAQELDRHIRRFDYESAIVALRRLTVHFDLPERAACDA